MTKEINPGLKVCLPERLADMGRTFQWIIFFLTRRGMLKRNIFRDKEQCFARLTFAELSSGS